VQHESSVPHYQERGAVSEQMKAADY